MRCPVHPLLTLLARYPLDISCRVWCRGSSTAVRTSTFASLLPCGCHSCKAIDWFSSFSYVLLCFSLRCAVSCYPVLSGAVLCCAVLCCASLLILLYHTRSTLCAGLVARVVDGGAGVYLRVLAVLVVLRQRAVGVRRELLRISRRGVQHSSQSQPNR